MFILFAVGGVGQPTSSDEIDQARGGKKDQAPELEQSPSRPPKPGEDTFVLSRKTPDTVNGLPNPRNKYLLAVEDRTRFDPSLRLTDDQKSELCESVARNPYFAGRRIRFREGGCSEENQKAIAESFLKQMESFKELKEIEKSRLAQLRKNQELERVFIAMSAFHPKLAVASLRNLIGSLQDPGAISLANGGISRLAGIAIQEAIKEAGETGDTSYARAIASMLNSGWAHSAHANAEHADGGFFISASHNNGEHTHTTFQEVVAEDADTGKALAVFYVPVISHNEGAHEDADQATFDTMSGVAQAARSGEIAARQGAGKHKEEQNISVERSSTEKIINEASQGQEERFLGYA